MTELYIHGPHRRGGLGTAALRFIERWLVDRGIRAFELDVERATKRPVPSTESTASSITTGFRCAIASAGPVGESGRPSALHHVSFGASDLVRARAFYDPLLETLGFRLMEHDAHSLDYGANEVLFCIEVPVDGRSASAGNGTHVAFHARSRAVVDDFHRVGLVCGGVDAGAPGLRPNYGAEYYGAFLHDLDGNKIEAVTFAAR